MNKKTLGDGRKNTNSITNVNNNTKNIHANIVDTHNIDVVSKKSVVFFISIIFILLLSIINVQALGIAPSKKIIDYDTEEHIITSRIINTDQKDATIRISASGPLSEYITIAVPIITMQNTESEKEFTYVMKLPEGIDPGTKTISITASEISSDMNENSIGGFLSLTQQLQIIVPYTGLYAEGKLSIYPTTANTPVNTMLELSNMGDTNIQSVYGTFKILDNNNNTIYTKNIDEYKNNVDITPKELLQIEQSTLLDNIQQNII
jgi:hypothetical protein